MPSIFGPHGYAVLRRQELLPAVLVEVRRNGRTFTLDSSASAAAPGRSIASRAWTVLTVTDAATTPAISNAGQPVASVPVPAHGSVILQLEVTDTFGTSDSARVTISASGGVSDSPPPDTGVHRGGGGGPDGLLLALLCVLLAATLARHRLSCFRSPEF